MYTSYISQPDRSEFEKLVLNFVIFTISPLLHLVFLTLSPLLSLQHTKHQKHTNSFDMARSSDSESSSLFPRFPSPRDSLLSLSTPLLKLAAVSSRQEPAQCSVAGASLDVIGLSQRSPRVRNLSKLRFDYSLPSWPQTRCHRRRQAWKVIRIS